MPIGVHTSIAGGVSNSIDRAVALGCDAVRIFGRNPRTWSFSPVEGTEAGLFKSKREKAGLWPVAVHTTYLINLCAPVEETFEKSVNLFKLELASAEALGADYLVTHLGSPGELGGEFARARILEALREAAQDGLGKKTGILLENTAGSGHTYGSSLHEIGMVAKGAEGFGLRVGLCLDTCHAFAAGYAMTTPAEVEGLVSTLDREAGLERVKLIHLNDSKGAFGSRLDRHEHIGEGHIGREGFTAILSHLALSKIPMILETPKKSEDDDRRNLKTVRDILKKARVQQPKRGLR
ncbi:MAG: deoxyribonuclease IV [Deltaproteobacteria bacterium]|nr:deoxyribonuclease IV [Deltaproteobacteria bacterium]